MISGRLYRGEAHVDRLWQSQPCDWVLEHDPDGSIKPGAEFSLYDIKYGSWGEERAWAIGTTFRHKQTGERIEVVLGVRKTAARLKKG